MPSHKIAIQQRYAVHIRSRNKRVRTTSLDLCTSSKIDIVDGIDSLKISQNGIPGTARRLRKIRHRVRLYISIVGYLDPTRQPAQSNDWKTRRDKLHGSTALLGGSLVSLHRMLHRFDRGGTVNTMFLLFQVDELKFSQETAPVPPRGSVATGMLTAADNSDECPSMAPPSIQRNAYNRFVVYIQTFRSADIVHIFICTSSRLMQFLHYSHSCIFIFKRNS